MIQVEHLTKRFGPITAIDDVSFEVEKGQILGFLGPNGAGKTTTMRILSGYFPATGGRARVAGFDVFEEALEMKKRVGYLPEIPPLYPQMTVNGYLRFAATIKAVKSSQIRNRVESVKERCGLSDWGRRLVRHLSKGYKQRVGLAQALIHDPEVLILDEPTIGLDPKQIIEVRELIKSLGGDHTVILSTHILPEVSMTCEKVIIIKKGRIAAVDTPENLTSQLEGGERVELEARGDKEGLLNSLGELSRIREVTVLESKDGWSRLLVEVEAGDEDVRPLLARTIINAGLDLCHLARKRMTLEEIFLELTTEEAVPVEGESGETEAELEKEDAV
ncbi:MAG: ABC transporter ATP-binding protein [Acidobacteriota bacterium]